MPTGIYKRKPRSEEYRKNIGKAHEGEKSCRWKGDKVGYTAVHDWVKKWRGKPEKCEGCGKDGLIGSKIHWANIDHQYRRVLEDYIRLCSKCHKLYDKENNLGKPNIKLKEKNK
jgi:hypothetical protein